MTSLLAYATWNFKLYRSNYNLIYFNFQCRLQINCKLQGVEVQKLIISQNFKFKKKSRDVSRINHSKTVETTKTN